MYYGFQLHFDDNQFENKRTDTKWKLKSDAIPTIFFCQSPAMEPPEFVTVYVKDDSIVQSEVNSVRRRSKYRLKVDPTERHSEVQVERLPPAITSAHAILIREPTETSSSVSNEVGSIAGSAEPSSTVSVTNNSNKLEEDFDTSKVKRVRLHVNRATPQTPIIVQLVDKTDHSQTPRYPYYQYLRFQIWNNKEPTKKAVNHQAVNHQAKHQQIMNLLIKESHSYCKKLPSDTRTAAAYVATRNAVINSSAQTPAPSSSSTDKQYVSVSDVPKDTSLSSPIVAQAATMAKDSNSKAFLINLPRALSRPFSLKFPSGLEREERSVSK